MYIKWMDTRIKTRVLTSSCFVCSDEEGVMEEIDKEVEHAHKTACFCNTTLVLL